MRVRPGRIEAGALLAILALAALVRLPGLDVRGAWDADQGHDMIVLDALVQRGEVPLLGPRTSVGTFHHGAVYYYLLAPAAAISNADPVAVTAEIALFGIGAVGAVWWLARRIGGPLAGIAGGLLAAVSPAGIDESTFIWNPNLIPFAAAVAYAAALYAWQSGRPRWWLLSALGAMVTMQCHVLGLIALPPLVIAYLADVRRRRAAGTGSGPLLRAGLGSVAIIAAGYLPLAINELTHDFAETRAILDYLAGGGRGSPGGGFPGSVVTVALRSVTWPFSALITDRPATAVLVFLVVAGLAGLAVTTGRSPDRRAASWLLLTVGWSVLALAAFAPSLAVVTPGLPNDHYHAFLDPLLLALAGVGLARLVHLRSLGAAIRAPVGGLRGAGPDELQPPAGELQRGADSQRGEHQVGRLAPVGGAVGVLLVAIAVSAWPPAVSPDGGWRLVDQAAARVIASVGGLPFALDGIPPFKSADALRFPLEHRGASPLPADALAGSDPPPAAVVVCDPLFADPVGAACGGPAEAAWLAGYAPALALAERFDAGPRRTISVYRVSAAAR